MKQSSTGDQANPPGLNEVPFLRQTKRGTKKSELIILLRPTIVQDGSDWSQDILDTQRRVQAMGRE
jgi:MSHA biogenesis protein MshL